MWNEFEWRTGDWWFRWIKMNFLISRLPMPSSKKDLRTRLSCLTWKTHLIDFATRNGFSFESNWKIFKLCKHQIQMCSYSFHFFSASFKKKFFCLLPGTAQNNWTTENPFKFVCVYEIQNLLHISLLNLRPRNAATFNWL